MPAACNQNPERHRAAFWEEKGLCFIKLVGSRFPVLSQALQNPRIRGSEYPGRALTALLLGFNKGAMAPPPVTSRKTAKSGQVHKDSKKQSGPFHSILLDSKGHLAAAKRGRHKEITAWL